mmetsp:Transcript_55581/g.178320  ORF Transcript_55581/g.178320 Transcript_55581/m.178320 type:complete len:318 (-) Transcript_55581:283-1236(-)
MAALSCLLAELVLVLALVLSMPTSLTELLAPTSPWVPAGASRTCSAVPPFAPGCMLLATAPVSPLIPRSNSEEVGEATRAAEVAPSTASAEGGTLHIPSRGVVWIHGAAVGAESRALGGYSHNLALVGDSESPRLALGGFSHSFTVGGDNTAAPLVLRGQPRNFGGGVNTPPAVALARTSASSLHGGELSSLVELGGYAMGDDASPCAGSRKHFRGGVLICGVSAFASPAASLSAEGLMPRSLSLHLNSAQEPPLPSAGVALVPPAVVRSVLCSATSRPEAAVVARSTAVATFVISGAGMLAAALRRSCSACRARRS